MTPSRISDRYEVLQTLGSGAAGVVLLAKDMLSGEQVAIKRFQQQSQGNRTALHEVAAILGLNHPNIIRCLDFCYVGTKDLYLVYEYVEGGTLADLLAERGHLTENEALSCLQQVLAGLAYLQANEIVHCDLKPANILLGADGVYKIGDLGVAHKASVLQESFLQVAGTPAYMAPERHRGECGFASDIYSVGVIFYEMLTGRLPFEGAPMEMARQHMRKPVDLGPVRDSALRDILSFMLDKEPAFRPSMAMKLIPMVEMLSDHMRSRKEGALGDTHFDVVHPPVNIDGFTDAGEMRVPYHCDAVLPMISRVGPIIGLEHGGRMDFLDLAHGCESSFHLLNTTSVWQLLGDGRMVYSTTSRICYFDAGTGEECTLVSDVTRVNSLFYEPSEGVLLWSELKRVCAFNLKAGARVSFPNPNFGLASIVRHASVGVVFSTGPVNPRFCVGGWDGVLSVEIPLPGPLIGLTSGPGSYLGLSISPAAGERYTLVHVDRNLCLQTRVLDFDIESYSFHSNSLFLLKRSGELLLIDAETLNFKTILELPQSTQQRSIHVSHRNRLLVVATENPSFTQLHYYLSHETPSRA